MSHLQGGGINNLYDSLQDSEYEEESDNENIADENENAPVRQSVPKVNSKSQINNRKRQKTNEEPNAENKEEGKNNEVQIPPNLNVDLNPEDKFKEVWTNGLQSRRVKEEQLMKIYKQIKGNLEVSNNVQQHIQTLQDNKAAELQTGDILEKYLKDNKNNEELLGKLEGALNYEPGSLKEHGFDEKTLLTEYDAGVVVAESITAEFKSFQDIFTKLKESPLAVCLLDFVALYEDMLLGAKEKQETQIINKNALTIYYFADLPNTIDENNKDIQEEMILNRFLTGGYYIRRVLTMLRHNYFDKGKTYIHFQDIIFDLEMRSILLDSLRLLHNDNFRKRRSHHRSLVDLKSLMFRLQENYISASKKQLQDDSRLLTPQLNLIHPVNFAKMPDNIIQQLDSIYTTTIIMLFDSTLVSNQLSARKTYKTYGVLKQEEEEDRVLNKAADGVDARKKKTGASSSFKNVKYLPVEKAVYIITCVNAIPVSPSISIGGLYQPFLSILYMTNNEIYNIVNRVMSRVLVHVRHYHQPKMTVEINDALELVLRDEYARAVLCELCGVDQFEVLGQSITYHTKFQLQMAVKLSEQHVEYLSFFLGQAYSRL